MINTFVNQNNENVNFFRNFMNEGKYFEDAMLEVSFHLLVRKIPSVVVEDANGNPTLALTSNGDVVTARFEEGHLIDRNLGTCIWKTGEGDGKNCSKGLYSLILHDLAKVRNQNYGVLKSDKII